MSSNNSNTAHSRLIDDDFLRIELTPEQIQQLNSRPAADASAALQQGSPAPPIGPLPPILPKGARHGVLQVVFERAMLVKNYGMVSMDPYIEAHISGIKFRTHTAYGAGRMPQWFEVLQFPIDASSEILYIDLFDERALTTDKLIASTAIPLEEYFVLNHIQTAKMVSMTSAKGGVHEGTLNIRIQYLHNVPFQPPTGPGIISGGIVSYSSSSFPVVVSSGQMITPGQPMMPVPIPPVQHPAPAAQPAQAHAGPSAAAINDMISHLKGCFPDLDNEILHSVLVSHGYDVNAATSALLDMYSL